ncbi:MAG TPA: hypothetical protein VFP72_14985 [Kineosporiaceae bacterium]|nr:hypothetical protein [Kineosporiaceae bacterium]
MTEQGIRAPRQLTYVRLGEIRPAEVNAKCHDIPGIIASLVEHGFIDSPIVDERTARLVGGHGRIEALVEMRAHGDPPPEGLLVDNDGEWLIPVYRGWSSRSTAHAKAVNILLNRLTEAGGWDNSVLAVELEAIHAADVNLFEGLGYTVDELDDIMRAFRDDDETRTGSPGVRDADENDDSTDDTDDDTAAGKPAHGEVECPVCAHVFVPGR